MAYHRQHSPAREQASSHCCRALKSLRTHNVPQTRNYHYYCDIIPRSSQRNVSSEMFLQHDLIFSSRKVPDAARAANHHKLSMGCLPVGPKWRDLRKIAAIQLFSNQQLDASQVIRRTKVNELVEHALLCCEKGLPVDIGKAVFTTSLNLLSSTIFSVDLASQESSTTQEFKDIIWHLFEESAKPSVSDFFPIFKHLDLQGVLRRTTRFYLQEGRIRLLAHWSGR